MIQICGRDVFRNISEILSLPNGIEEWLLKSKWISDGVVGGGDSEVFARLRSALSECENDVESPTTPLRPPLSPITENKVLSKSRAGSTHHTHADRPYPLPPRSRKLTLTR